ncbi:MAG: membrane protein insertase YidC [Gammaproteobacteria bacterium]|nr:MAG: membrane protein insertase YidC [Gammaproteobacteria bacterium]
MSEGDDVLTIPLRWINSKGMVINKIITLERGSYLIGVKYRVENSSAEKLSATFFGQLKRDQLVEEDNSGGGLGIRAYLGSAYSTKEKRYERYDFDDMNEANLNVSTEGGWIAYLQHYFISAWVPDQSKVNQIATLTPGGMGIIRVMSPKVTVNPGELLEVGGHLYLGPKIQEKLEVIADGLDLTVDYGFLWWIGQPLFWLLHWFNSIIGSWGLAIIMVTVTVKSLFYPLSNAQYRSFAKMRTIQPKITALKERIGDDRQKMSQAMMELYKKEKVNPLGGCLPLLVQMPVFIALYWVLLETVELRHAEFYLWIHDLSAKDPYYILPLLMGASMFLMQKMQPVAATMDPMQQKIMQFMPVIMTVFFLFFPAGLVLYWLVNNLLSIAQQLYVTRKIEREFAEKNSKKSLSKPSKKQKS